MNYLKTPTFRSEAWRRAVASLDCVWCKAPGPCQAAHANHLGKGMGLKVADCWTVPLCPECHSEFDQGRKLTKEDRRELMEQWLILTINDLATKGLVRA